MMNSLRGHQNNTNPVHLRLAIAGGEKSNEEWGNYRQYSRYTEAQALRSSVGTDVEWDRPSPSSQTWHNDESDTEDPDGQLYEPDEEDPELVRKRKELQVIEERILLKKAAIALKNVDPFLKKMSSGSGTNEEGEETCGTLRDRVKTILQQQHPHGCLSKGQAPTTRIHSTSIRQDDHPLKLRVESLLRRRFTDHSVEAKNIKAPFDSTPPSQNVTSSPNVESNANKGFMRFLDILNKGVDINLLSRIVNDDSETLPTVEDASGPSSSPQHRLSQTDSRGKNGVASCHGEKRLRFHSKSPPSQKKIGKEEDGQPNLDEQQKQLQNVLQSLGLSLEIDEMSRLADRTQERLYGKKQGIKEKSDGEEQEGKEKYSPGHYTRSSSCSSSGSSTSGRSSSSSPCSSRKSPEKSNHKNMHLQYQTFPHLQSNAYSYNYTVSASPGSNHSSTHLNHQIYPYSQTDEFSALYNNSHYYEYSDHYSYDSTNPNNHWTYNHPIPTSNTPSVLPTQHLYNNFPGTVPEANTNYEGPLDQKGALANCNFSSNNDQKGAHPRCLITVKQSSFATPSEQFKYITKHLKNNDKNIYKQKKKARKQRSQLRKQLETVIEQMRQCDQTDNTETKKQLVQAVKAVSSNKKKRKARRRRKFMEMTQEELEAKRSGPTTRSKTKRKLADLLNGWAVPTDETESGLQLVVIEDVETGLETETITTNAESGGQCVLTDKAHTDEERVLTEEEIKANLKKKLEAFNKRMKQNFTQPVNYPTSHSLNVEDEI